MANCRIFLSHLTVESRLAEAIKRHIDEDFIGLVDVFVSSDRTSIPVGTKWLEELVTAIAASRMHLVLCSPESIQRPWIHYEAGAARLKGLPCVPLCHSGLSHVQLPVPLSDGQGIQLADPAGIRALYRSIAELLGSKVPNVDFDRYAKEVMTFEQEYSNNRESTLAGSTEVKDRSQIVNPRVVCVTSKQFMALGFENQIDTVLEAFPQKVKHNRITTSRALRKLLLSEEVDVVHIAAFVCPRSGDLYFSDVDLATGIGISSDNDVLAADALAELLQGAKTRLVVVGSCESLVLAATLLPVTNVVATRDMVSAKMMAKWVDTFYTTLSKKPLSFAFQLAVKESGAPMRLYARTEVKVKTATVPSTGIRQKAAPGFITP